MLVREDERPAGATAGLPYSSSRPAQAHRQVDRGSV